MRVKMRRLQKLLALSFAAMLLTPGLVDVAALPSAIVMRAGDALQLPASSLLRAEVVRGDAVLGDGDGAFCLRAEDAGSSTLSYSLMGIWPFKTVNVSAEPERRLIPGGQSVGIAIDSDGVIVVGASDLGTTPSPARLAGIRAGDIIERVNGEAIDSAETLSDCLAGGGTVTLDVLREGKSMACQVTPALDSRDGCWRLGAWVRDSTAGVGTLTFIDPETGLYGALGHAITDADTSVTMPVGVGELYRNNVVDVTPSRRGAPGELTGDFVFHPQLAGTVEHNSARGIFGHTTAEGTGSLYPEGLPVARRAEIHPGPATLIATVDAGGPREYACEVVRLNNTGGEGRSMVIRATDPALVEATGGIVQGMSGSPLIQDGRLIGAVTHVMVNDPAMGYGIDIEAMLKEASGVGANKNERNEE